MITASIDGLLPCPFCGSELTDAEGGLFHRDEPEECVLSGMSWSADYYRSSWNTRAPAPSLGEVDGATRRRVAEAIVAAFVKGSPDLAKTLSTDWRDWTDEADAALSSMRPVQEEGVGENLSGEVKLLRSMLDSHISRFGPNESFMIRAGFLRDILDALAHPEASPPSLGVEELRELSEKATPFRREDLMAYDHGGGRLAILRDGQRQLIADFYGDGPDRDFFMAAALWVRSRVSGRSEDTVSGRVGCAETGSTRFAPQAPAGLGPSGDDPARIPNETSNEEK